MKKIIKSTKKLQITPFFDRKCILMDIFRKKIHFWKISIFPQIIEDLSILRIWSIQRPKKHASSYFHLLILIAKYSTSKELSFELLYEDFGWTVQILRPFPPTRWKRRFFARFRPDFADVSRFFAKTSQNKPNLIMTLYSK